MKGQAYSLDAVRELQRLFRAASLFRPLRVRRHEPGETLDDRRHGGRGFFGVDGDAHHLGAGERKRPHLQRGRLDVGGVGVGHRLHDDRLAAAHGHVADADGNGLAAGR